MFITQIRRSVAFFFTVLFSLIATPKLDAKASPTIRFQKLNIDGEIYKEPVYAAITSQQGFIWMSTDYGVIRFDGYSKKSYLHDPNNDNSLSSNFTNSIMEDSNGDIWIGTDSAGLNRLNIKTNTFTRYYHDEEKPDALSYGKVVHIYEDKFGYIWASTFGGGLNRLDPKTGNFIRYLPTKNENSISHLLVRKVLSDEVGNLWIASNGGVDYFDQSTKRFTHYGHDSNDPTSISSNIVRSIYYDKNGDFWVGTSVGLNKFNPTTKTFERIYLDKTELTQRNDNNVINTIYEDHLNQFWIGTIGGGIKLFDRETLTFTSYNHDPSDLYSLNSDRIKPDGIFQDHQNTLWILTNGGINRLNTKAVQFKHYQHQPHNPESISGNLIWAVHEDRQGQLWFGTDKSGLNQFDKQKQQFIRFQHDRTNPNSISSNRIFSIHVDKEGTLWAGSDRGLIRRDKDSDVFKQYVNDPNDIYSINSNFIFELNEDNEGNILIGTEDGLTSFNKKRQRFEKFPDDDSHPASTSSATINVIFVDRSHHIWIGTLSGLHRYDPKLKKFHHYYHDPEVENSLTSSSVISMSETKNGHFWLGLNGSGLNYFDVDKQQFRAIPLGQGFEEAIVYSINEDDNGFLWLSTNNGMLRLDPKTNKIQIISETDGIYKRLSNGEAIRTSSGEIVIIGNEGFNTFHPNEIKFAPRKSSIIFTDFLVFNRSASINDKRSLEEKKSTNPQNSQSYFSLEHAIEMTSTLTLTYRESLFAFEFSSLNYDAPSKSQYAYKLEGWDNEWIYTNHKNRLATYTNLPDGEYLLRVRTAENIEDLANIEKTIKVKILPPPWKTWWAYTFYVLAFFTLIFLIILLIYKRKIAEKDRESSMAIATAKERLFANISHEFRTPLTLILGPSATIKSLAKDAPTQSNIELIERNAKRLLSLVDQILDLARMKGERKKERQVQDVYETIHFLEHSFHSLLTEKELSLTLDFPIEEKLYVKMAPDALTKVLINLLSNAFKYSTSGGKITIKVRKISSLENETLSSEIEQSFVSIIISDTGCGMSETELPFIFDRFTRLEKTEDSVTGSGIGLALVKEIINAHNGSIDVTSQLNTGSEFTIRLPLHEQSISHEHLINQSSKVYIDQIIDQLAPEHQPSQLESNHNLSDSSKPTILIIEDNLDMQRYLYDILSANYICLTANNGEEGIESAKRNVPDIIISDVMMPKVDGYQVVKTLKEELATSHIPIILLTAKGDKQSRIRGWQQNVDEYLTKPFDKDELLIRVDNILNIRNILSQRFNFNLHNKPKHSTPVALKSKPAPLEDDNEKEQQFVDKLTHVLEQRYSETELSVLFIAQDLALSERQFFRKVKAILGITPNEFIRSFRLKKSIDLLKNGKSPSIIAFDVGFSSHSYFSRCFKAQYGFSPTEFTKEKELELESI